MRYQLKHEKITDGRPILADFPRYVEPLQSDLRLRTPPLVSDDAADLTVRAWRWWYNARAIIEMDNRLEAKATAVVVVHPWGIDDGHGLQTPRPGGVAFQCTREKNLLALAHMREVVSPFLDRLRNHVGLVAYSLTGAEDPIRKLMYASISTPLAELDVAEGERQLRRLLDHRPFTGEPLAEVLDLDPRTPVSSYFAQTPATEHGDRRNGAGFWQLPMPLSAGIRHHPGDLVLYDDEGYAKVRDFFKQAGIRHVLLAGYCTDMCVVSTTCGYQNFSRDFNVFVVGDATMASFPASTTPRFATQAALANAALHQLITQVGWVASDP